MAIDAPNFGCTDTDCTPCAVTNAQANCSGGACAISACNPGYADCDNLVSTGCETTLGTAQDCASCGDGCSLSNAVAACEAPGGVYACTFIQCDPGYSDCNNNLGDGCETHSDVDPGNCGNCGNICPFGPHSSPTCTDGGCGLACDPGYDDCNNDPNDGCEIHSAVDPGNCGACRHNCQTSYGSNVTSTQCHAGICTITACASGYSSASGDCAAGCQ